MEDEKKSDIQLLRADIAASCPNLPDFKIIEMCMDYGIQFEIPDTNTLRLFMLLASAERKLMNNMNY
ncbi:hypothetical protein [Algoriphagus resistens]|uniref:hypothetical protein n=1 Tax=Algoriphagus resistens TaxID=1750590 RepID=UPI0007168F06|nr:hypothetical protein [Algoriphagus resistens]